MLVSDLITDAFLDLGVISVNETITTSMQTDGFNQSNLLLDSLSAEGLVVPNQIEQTFNLQAAVVGYTLGSGGTFPTTGNLRAMKVTSWRSYFGTLLQSGGRVFSLPEFAEACQLANGELAAIPRIVGADTAYPLINVRVSPPPSQNPGVIELGYWTPFTNFVTVGDAVTLPQGLARLLHWLLAKELYTRYPSPQRWPMIQAGAQEAKAALIELNAMTAPQPQPAAPQGQK